MDNKITGSDMQDLDSRLTNLETDFHMYMGKMDLLIASFMTPYTARHTYATELQNNNVPMKTSMQIMGHEDERMLMRVYVHSYEQDTLNAQNRMHEYYRTIVK